MNAQALNIVLWPLLGGAIYYLVYGLLPLVACHLDTRLAAALQPNRAELNYDWHKWIPRQILDYLQKRLLQAGFRTPNQLNLYLLTLVLPSPVMFALALALGGSPGRAGLCGFSRGSFGE